MAKHPTPHATFSRLAPWLFLLPFLATVATFTAWPLFQSFLLSFQQTYGPRTSIWVGLENFRYLLGDPRFHKALTNTAVFAAGSVFLQLPLSLGLAMLLNRPDLRGRAFFRLVFFSPALVGLVFAGVLFGFIFEKRTGLLNASLHALFPAFNPEFAWLQSYIMPALILASLWLYVGFNMVYFLAALQAVSRDQVEAALIDGAGPWQRFRHVVWPEIRPVASFVILLSLLGSFQLFELPYILLNNGGGPEDRGLTVVMYLYEVGFLKGDLGYASATGWVLALILFFFAWVQRRLSRDEAV